MNRSLYAGIATAMATVATNLGVAAAFLVWLGSGLSASAQTPIRELPPPPKLYTDAEAEVFAERLKELDREDRASIRSVIQRLGIDQTRIGPGRVRIGSATEWTDHQISRSYWITESRGVAGITNVKIAKTFPPNPPIEARRPGDGDGEPWLQFRVTEADLGKITASRCTFVFPKDVVAKDTHCYAMKDGYLFVAKEMLYITDRAGKLVVEHNLPQPSHRGGFHRGDDWFGYSEANPGSTEARLRIFKTNGREIGTVAVPKMCMAVVSRDASRVFFLRMSAPDTRYLAGPIVADVRIGKILREHQFAFVGSARGYTAPTKDGLVAQLNSSGGLICFSSEGEIAWRSPFRGFGYAATNGEYVLASAHRAGAFVLKVLDAKGQTALEKPLRSTGHVRLLPDGERLLLACDEDNQRVRQLYRLNDGSRLWSVPHPLAHAGEFDYACLSPDGARLASFTHHDYHKKRPIGEQRRVVFTIAVLDLATGAELLRQELPFREKDFSFRQPRWTDAKTIELIPADYLYRIRLKF